jgi:MtN3 and saliva related transmembrane protein
MLEISPEVIGTAATVYGVGAAAAALLQARHIVRRGRSCDVSARFFASYVGGYAIWLLYGVSIGSMPLILVDLVGLLCGGFTLTTTLALRGPLLRPSSWNSCPE